MMKLKNLLIFIALIQFGFVVAQNINHGSAIYERILSYNNDSSISKSNFILTFSNEKSLFLEKDTIVKGNIVKRNKADSGTLSLNVKITSLVPYAVFTDFKANKIQSRLTLNSPGKKETVIVSENLKKINWKLFNEYKKIGNFTCQKAVGQFRGRNYTVWFANKIPIRVGPWKFNNLPGIIVEVYDDLKEVYFGLRAINISPSKSKEIKLESTKEMRNLTLQEYVKESENELENLVGAFGSKLPRGVVMDIQTTKISAIELSYDFKQ